MLHKQRQHDMAFWFVASSYNKDSSFHEFHPRDSKTLQVFIFWQPCNDLVTIFKGRRIYGTLKVRVVVTQSSQYLSSPLSHDTSVKPLFVSTVGICVTSLQLELTCCLKRDQNCRQLLHFVVRRPRCNRVGLHQRFGPKELQNQVYLLVEG